VTNLEPPPDDARASGTRPFKLFTALAVIFGVAGVVQLFTSVTAAFAAFGGAGLMLGIREILRRSVPPE
jgi:uncharacterized membrane protein HdeD (DUF308 family)